jgi:uncharacterized protein YkwD
MPRSVRAGEHGHVPRITRLVLALLAVFTVGAAVTLPAASPASATTAVEAAEARMVELLKQDRASRGLPAVNVDPRLMTIARARSVDMATKHYFSHTQPDGQTASSMIKAAGIAWERIGEIIAYNSTSDLISSANGANNQWLNSSGHYAIITQPAYTHIGVGLAIDSSNGRRLWTAVWLDAPAGSVPAPTPTPPPVSTLPPSQWMIVRWSSTTASRAGLGTFSHYQVHRRVDGGHWAWWDFHQTVRAVRAWWSRGHVNELRVRAVDTRGRTGTWSSWFRYQP